MPEWDTRVPVTEFTRHYAAPLTWVHITRLIEGSPS